MLMTFGLDRRCAFGMSLDAHGTPPTGAGAVVARRVRPGPRRPAATPFLATFVNGRDYALGIAGLAVLQPAARARGAAKQPKP
ncbi:MAG: hypothetical protein MZV70_05720 [Desulfobacterales bacterium]|nr:hypothetical protein [Desulfobacterales bacterium]